MLAVVDHELLERIERQLDPDYLSAAERGRVNAYTIAEVSLPDHTFDDRMRLAEWILAANDPRRPEVGN